AYAADARALWQAIGEAAPAGTRWVIDSSKTAYGAASRPLTFASAAGAEVFFVHLVRDPRGVADSYARKGLNRTHDARPGLRSRVPASALRAVVGWAYAQRCAERVARHLGPGRATRLRYEDLATRPADVVRRLGEWTGLGLEGVLGALARGAPVPVTGHQIAGNRLRRLEATVIRPATDAPSPLGPAASLALRAFAGGLLERYGYSR
ncbi:MAG: sulfotransferase, partial [Gemmatimonadetes bacterium]